MPKRLTISLSFKHERILRRIAKADEEPISVILRQLIREEARERGLWQKDPKRVLAGRASSLSERLLIRVSPFHKRITQQMARADGESISAFVRRLIREEALRRSLWLEIGRR